jgi:hypothetical protein
MTVLLLVTALRLLEISVLCDVLWLPAALMRAL